MSSLNNKDYFLVAFCFTVIFVCMAWLVNERDKKTRPVEIVCTWDIPAQSIGADLPPLPVRKGQ